MSFLLSWAESPCQIVCACARKVCAGDKQRLGSLLLGRFNPCERWLMEAAEPSPLPFPRWGVGRAVGGSAHFNSSCLSACSHAHASPP